MVECRIALDYRHWTERTKVNLGQTMPVAGYPCESNRPAVAAVVQSPVVAELRMSSHEAMKVVLGSRDPMVQMNHRESGCHANARHVSARCGCYRRVNGCDRIHPNQSPVGRCR